LRESVAPLGPAPAPALKFPPRGLCTAGRGTVPKPMILRRRWSREARMG
jgi:hypothetical protein